MDVLLASAAPEDVTADLHRRLCDAGHELAARRDVERCEVLVVLVGMELDTDGLVDLMQVLGQARRLDVPVIGVTDCPPEKHPPAIGALGLGDAWIRLDEGADDELDARLARLVASADERVNPDERATPSAAAKPVADDPAPGSAKTPLQVFVSYSRRDEALAKGVVGELRQRGMGVWVDTTNIPGGERWRGSIERGIRRCDVVVVLLSPNVVRYPEWVEAELGVAQTAGKRIIPVLLKRTPSLPDGFGLMLSGTHMIDLYADYGAGITKLVTDLGGDPDSAAAAGVVARVRRFGRQARRFAEQHDIGSKAAFLGAAVLTVAGAVAAANAKNEKERRAEDEERRATEQQELSAQQVAARERYAEATIRLLNDGMAQMDNATEMTPSEYRREVKPEMMRIIGKLEFGRPHDTDSSFVARHDQLVKDLEQLVLEFDRLADKVDRGEATEHATRRIIHAYSNTSRSGLQWLKQVLGVE